MAIPFNPPDALIRDYINQRNQQPNPIQQSLDSIGQIAQMYRAQKMQERTQQNDALSAYIKAFEAGGPDLATEVGQRMGLLHPPVLPGVTKTMAGPGGTAGVMSNQQPAVQAQAPASIPSPMSTEMPSEIPGQQSMVSGPLPPLRQSPEEQMQQSLPSQHQSPIIAHWNATMGGRQQSPTAEAPAPASPAQTQTPAQPPMAGAIPGLENPEELVNRGTWGVNRLKAGEALGSFREKQQTAEEKRLENSPKSFDYAKAFATSAGADGAADPFIAIAQKEGRTNLYRREMDDIKNAINASAQRGRGEFFATQSELNKQKFDNELLNQANKNINPNVATGALKQQQERLNRIGRAESLVQQMASQKGGGDTRQVRELATSLASVLTGGNVVAQSQIEELIPQTYKGRALEFFEKLSNNPTGLEQQAFINRLSDTLGREKNTINSQIKVSQNQALPAMQVLKKRNPKAYQEILDANVNSPAYGNQPDVPTVSSDQEFNALPSGSQFKDPSGQVHRKK
jgi:hypothetical protein